MSLPQKSEKAYLHIETAERSFLIAARTDDADALAALFLQYGISCYREPGGQPGEDVLQFSDGVERTQVEQVLARYVTAKGS